MSARRAGTEVRAPAAAGARAWPEASAVRAMLARVTRRLRLIAAAEGAAIGLGLALAVAAITLFVSGSMSTSAAIALAAGIVGVVAGAAVAAARAPAAAPLIERRVPRSRNIVLTASELIDSPARVPAHIGARVCAEAADTLRSFDPARLFPARRAAAALAAALLAWAIAIPTLLLLPTAAPGARLPHRAASAAPAIDAIEAVITPPPYSGRAAERIADPARIEALAGSRVSLVVRARAAAARIETVAGRDTLRRDGDTFTGDVVVDADGYIAVEAAAADGRSVRRLIGVTATPDRAPGVRITAPAADLTLPDGERSLEVSVTANDDIGLASLAVTFTRVSGSGEQYDFRDGVVPLAVTRESGTAWRARGVLRLDTLRLQPGDLVVYRALARDARPDAPAAESDALIVEIAAPGDIPAGGFSSDEEERYALSQQMVLVKTERLVARADSIPADSVADEAARIAAEQRAVRAGFVFMMGGELAEEVLAEASMEDLDEAAHAELDDEAIAGRLRNRGRLDLLRAIRAMSGANAALIDVDLERALREERAAIELLQRAFSRTRYILRALTVRERLDLSRRLTGNLAGVGRVARPVPDAAMPARLVALRRTLADVAALTAASGAAAGDGAARAALAVLRVDPSAPALRDIARNLDAAAAAFSSGRTARARALLDSAAVDLARTVGEGLGRAPAPPPPLEHVRLHGALTDALRRDRP